LYRCTAVLAVLAAMLAARDGAAQVSGVVDLATVPTTSDLVRVHGSVGTGAFGVPVAGGFDCDGDGFTDYAMASMLADPLGRIDAGQVFLVFGDGTVTGTLDTADPNEPRVLHLFGDGAAEITGSEIWMDDVTGDGLGDLLIARQNFTPDPARIGAGALTIVVGAMALRTHAATLQPLDLRTPPGALTLLTIVGGQELGRFGMWLRTGDVTGDGVADIVVGADQESDAGESHRGAVYVIRGGPHLAVTQTVDLADFGTTALAGHLARVTPPTGAAEYHFGGTVQVGDLDKNGRAEVLVAAALNRAAGTLRAAGAPSGSAHGSGGTTDGTVFIAWDDNFPAGAWTAGYTFDVTMGPGAHSIVRGGVRNRSFGEEMLAGLDYDDDGEPDLFVGDIVGDGTAAQNRPASGSGHVLYAAAGLKGLETNLDATPFALLVTTFLGPAPVSITADTAMHGDFDGDFIADLAFSSPHGSPGGRTDAGIIHVVHGQSGPWPPLIDLMPGAVPHPADVRITEIYGAQATSGADRGDTLCYSGASGHIDSDGKLDILTNEMLGNGLAPGTVDVGNLVVIGGALIAAAPFPPGSLPPQTKEQQRCVNEVNTRGATVAATQGAVGVACVKAAARGQTAKLGTPPQTQTAQACLGNDVGHKIARRVDRLTDREGAKCLDSPGQLPDFAFTGAATIAAAATGEVVGLVADLFGAGLDAALVSYADQRAGARCQLEVLKRTRRVFEALWKHALSAKKDALRGRHRVTGGDPSAPVTNVTELRGEIQAVIAADPRDRVGRAVARLTDHAAAKCTPALVATTLAALFPGDCAGVADPAALATCAARAARCRFCAALNAFDALALDCDAVDDGVANASCGDPP
jgi:hypothetical protein